MKIINKLFEAIKNNYLGLSIMFLTWLLFFSRTIFLRSVYYLDDLKIIFYPLEHAYAQFQQSFSLPQWSPYFGFGHPLIAWGQLGFFTPLHFILRFFYLHPLTLIQISIITYFGIGLLGSYFFFKRLSLSQVASSVGSLVYVFTGFHVGHLNHVNFYTSTMLLPWLLLTLTFFLNKPNVKRAVTVSLVSAGIALSGQPQIVTYVFTISFIYSVILFIHKAIDLSPKLAFNLSFVSKILSLSLLSITLGLLLSSFATLPLFEFIPLTDRSSSLPPEELLDFSYPPFNTITLIFPYFFGGHEDYWGPKGFQELAAFTGIIPLLLATSALINWQKNKKERIFAIILIVIGTIGSLGKYTPIYTYLVTNHHINNINIPGRFIFFFITGLSVLAACGFHDLFSRSIPKSKSQQSNFSAVLFSLIITSLIFAPALAETHNNPRFYHQLLSCLDLSFPATLLFLAGIFLFIVTTLLFSKPISAYLGLGLVLLMSATLVMFSWNFNPLTPAKIAYSTSPFSNHLKEWNEKKETPPRLLFTKDFFPSDQSQTQQVPSTRTDPISPLFTIHQPITITRDNFNCINFPTDIPEHPTGTVQITLSKKIGSTPLRSKSINIQSLESKDVTVCFRPIQNSENGSYFLSFSSSYFTNLRLYYKKDPRPDQRAFFVRVPNPSPNQLEKSLKEARIVYQPKYSPAFDTESGVITRHLQATHNTSSALWIGALSIKPFREFVDLFFANDNEPYGGDGLHVIERYRDIINLSGITHISQKISAGSSQLPTHKMNFELISKANIGYEDVVLYENKNVLPKAFLVRNSQFIAGADETRAKIINSDFSSDLVVYIDGNKPPPKTFSKNHEYTGNAIITKYKPSSVDIDVETNQDAFLVLNDSYTPQWQTYLDENPVDSYIAYSVFRAAYVPAGKHTISFRYFSPAIALAKKLTTFSLVVSIILLFAPHLAKRTS